MKLLNRLTISHKLTLLGALTSTLALTLLAISLGIYDIRNIRTTNESFYGTVAEIAGENCIEALQAGDSKKARLVLQALRHDPHIMSVQLRDRHGRLFVNEILETDSSVHENGSSPHREVLTIRQPLMAVGRKVGEISLYVTSSRLWREGREHTLLILGGTLAGVLIAALLAGYLQRQVSAPVLHLVQTARAISVTRDYSRRAVRQTDDEFGQLCDEFNNMLVQIESRDAELEMHHRHLEDLVRLRTEALEQKTQEALAASVAKSQFLANMSHEIRTPMNGILGFADLLQRGLDDGDPQVRKEYLDIISTCGKHLLAIINDILDLSKIEAGKLVVERIPCAPHQVISEAVSVLSPRAMEKNLKLTFDWIGNRPASIETDPARLRQLLINLVGNAVKFTEKGSVSVTGQIVTDDNGTWLKVEVHDTGKGIASECLATIFKPFCQADPSVTRQFGGTGLGLAITKHLVTALGGTVEVTSKLHEGSTFTILIEAGSISMGPALNQLSEPQTGMVQAVEGWQGGLGPGKVLLVEDGETNRKLVRILLQRQGLELVEANNGAAGVTLAECGDFDVILMDMQMPVMDGYTAVSRLREMNNQTPIVALTAHAMSGDEERCRLAGCDAYLTKPIDEARLLQTLARFFSSSIEMVSSQTRPARTQAQVEHEGQPWLISNLPMNDDDFREIVKEFIVKVEVRVERMRICLDLKDWEGLMELSHWLVGSGGTAGYPCYTFPASRLEQAAKQQNADACRQIVADIAELTRRLRVPGLFGEADTPDLV